MLPALSPIKKGSKLKQETKISSFLEKSGKVLRGSADAAESCRVNRSCDKVGGRVCQLKGSAEAKLKCRRASRDQRWFPKAE